MTAHLAIIFFLWMKNDAIRFETIKHPISIRTFAEKKASPPAPTTVSKPKQTKAPLSTTAPKHKQAEALPRKKNSPKCTPECTKERTHKIDNHLLQQISESLETIAAPTQMARQVEISLPQSIEIAKMEKSDQQFRYKEMILTILQNQLELPEFGEVIVKIKINEKGSVFYCEILKTQSNKNGEFLKKRLQELTFPCFNEYGMASSPLDFTITFYNVENR